MIVFYYISCVLWGMFCGASKKGFLWVISGVTVLWALQMFIKSLG